MAIKKCVCVCVEGGRGKRLMVELARVGFVTNKATPSSKFKTYGELRPYRINNISCLHDICSMSKHGFCWGLTFSCFSYSGLMSPKSSKIHFKISPQVLLFTVYYIHEKYKTI